LLLFAFLLAPGRSVGSNDIQVSSPNGRVKVTLFARGDRLSFGVTLAGKSVLEPSPMEFTLDGVNLMAGTEVGVLEPYQFNETYRCWGGHAWATNHYTGAMLSLRHPSSNTSLFLEVRAFDDALAFRYVVPGGAIAHVPDEATTFVVPTGSTVWFHDLVGHYEGVHVKTESSEIKEGKWAGPPV